MTEANLAESFHALHRKGAPLVLFNIWDPGSARIVAKAGAAALATGSWPVAAAHGFADGEIIPFAMMLDNLRRIVAAVDLPVSCDLESGYGATAEAVGNAAAAVAGAGAVGFNLEDQDQETGGIRPLAEQAARIKAARQGADRVASRIFLNARTDIFLKTAPELHSAEMLTEALTRARAYADAGADGFFAPGLANSELIGALCQDCPLPVNIIALPHVPEAKFLAGLGVARISHGPVPYRKMSAWLEAEARAALQVPLS